MPSLIIVFEQMPCHHEVVGYPTRGSSHRRRDSVTGVSEFRDGRVGTERRPNVGRIFGLQVALSPYVDISSKYLKELRAAATRKGPPALSFCKHLLHDHHHDGRPFRPLQRPWTPTSSSSSTNSKIRSRILVSHTALCSWASTHVRVAGGELDMPQLAVVCAPNHLVLTERSLTLA